MVRTQDLPEGPLSPWLESLAEGRAGLLLLGPLDPSAEQRLPSGLPSAALPEGADAQSVRLAVEGLFERVELRRSAAEERGRLERDRYELGELIEIARVMMQERDIERLLDLILERSRFVTGADAGSIYVVEKGGDEATSILRFKLSQNDSVDFESSEFTVPVSPQSIAGYAVVRRQPINIPDVDHIPQDAPYGFDGSFDRRVGYRTRSMLAVPMISAEDEVIGVIQLINRKRDPGARLTGDAPDHAVVPFDRRCEQMLSTLATQAGIALENAMLYDEIKRIFEGFVHASVQAIEQRDPTTSGHSLRVSVLSDRLARTVGDVRSGPYRDVSFSRRELKELEYASMLHDFGKIGVREEVLVKAKKLYPHQFEGIRERIHYAIKAAEADAMAEKVARLERGAPAEELRELDDRLERRRDELERAWQTICEANEPTVLSEGEFTRIAEIGEFTFVDGHGRRRRVLEPEEVESLQVKRGSLRTEEMEEIRSHVTHTFNFLSKIPWGKSFRDVPRIAGMHHEKLDGSGYPAQLTGESIPLQSKIMTVADIYDALTARDRPYKKAVPVPRALEILGFEVEAGHVEPELVRIFRESEIYRSVEGY
jgi:HD-GYP domain-containing protein (c-di-GMP phosphodiesterase class II)